MVVASAGNYGQTPEGKLIYGSITSPGISPYAITVGALRTQGTADPSDDEVAPWSSKGPTLVDHIVKPDLVAPGSKIVSTAVKGSTLVNQFPDRLVDGPGARDYFSMSGTSMAAAVVSGAVALLLDGRPDSDAAASEDRAASERRLHAEAGLFAGGAGSLDLRISRPNSATLRHGTQIVIRPEVSLLGVKTDRRRNRLGNVIVWGDGIVWGDVIIWGDGNRLG